MNQNYATPPYTYRASAPNRGFWRIAHYLTIGYFYDFTVYRNRNTDAEVLVPNNEAAAEALAAGKDHGEYAWESVDW